MLHLASWGISIGEATIVVAGVGSGCRGKDCHRIDRMRIRLYIGCIGGYGALRARIAMMKDEGRCNYSCKYDG